MKVSPLWRWAFFISAAIVLVPASLLEFRYFIIPFLFILLHSMPPIPREAGDKKKAASYLPGPTCVLILELVLFAVVNAVTFYIFLHRPFLWPSGEVARIMW